MSATSVLLEYGQAIRGDWSDIDGRSVRAQLQLVVSWIDLPVSFPGDPAARRSLGLCVSGGGHWCGTWYGYCNKLYDCACPDDPSGGS